MTQGTPPHKQVSYHALQGVAFSVDSRLTAKSGRRIFAIYVQRPGVQAHAYGCASTPRLLLVAEILQADILRRVVVRVYVVSALQTLKLVLSVVVRAVVIV
ncbi:hypothetical protein HALLA_02135 (plasmid) [Halostagnicola larsenii XH-48]|uniref:Uncharacterized protein n=1 Tax=Halostagnicola larsenii XH-48 TaxID=797299 RepID=W0JU64_9EURY|nr:hypothetical protein HALLA_02135 [Halostagnicola larsenii XH-48]